MTFGIELVGVIPLKHFLTTDRPDSHLELFRRNEQRHSLVLHVETGVSLTPLRGCLLDLVKWLM